MEPAEMKWNEARHGPQKPAARDGRLTSSGFGIGWESIQQVGSGTGFTKLKYRSRSVQFKNHDKSQYHITHP